MQGITESEPLAERKRALSDPVSSPSQSVPSTDVAVSAQQQHLENASMENNHAENPVLSHDGNEDRTDTNRRNGSLPSKEAAEVAAAARFISQIDSTDVETDAGAGALVLAKPRLGSSTSVRDSILDGPLNVSKSRTSKRGGPTGKRRKNTRPPPLKLAEGPVHDEDVRTPLPERVSSRGAPSFDLARPADIAKQSQSKTVTSNLEVDLKSPLPTLTPESATSFQFDFSIPTEPQLSRTLSVTTTASQVPLTPHTAPAEDQLHSEIELYSLDLQREPEASQLQLRSRSNSANTAHSDPVEKPLPQLTKDVISKPLPPITETNQDIEGDGHEKSTASPVLRRKRSIFGWLQKRAEVDVDDLIDLYLTDEQIQEVKTTRQKTSKPRLPMFRNRVATDPLPLKAG